MDWEKQVTRRVMECAGEHSSAQLQFLLQRLKAHPETLPAIAQAMEDMGRWSDQQAAALRAEMARREARDRLAEIVNQEK